jgi:hypothetical protein
MQGEARQPGPEGARPTPGRNTEALINRILDLEAEGALHEARRVEREGCASDAAFARKLARARAAIAGLALLPPAPDVRLRVLDAVEARRGFLSRKSRRRVSAGRVAVTAGALAAFACAMVFRRVDPTPLGDPGAPVTGLVKSARADLAASLESLGAAAAQLRSDLLDPPDWRPHPPLSLGDTSGYEVNVGGGGRPVTRLVLMSVPDRSADAPTHRSAPRGEPAAPLSASQTVGSVVRSEGPVVGDRLPANVWMVWDGARWVRAQPRTPEPPEPGGSW